MLNLGFLVQVDRGDRVNQNCLTWYRGGRVDTRFARRCSSRHSHTHYTLSHLSHRLPTHQDMDHIHLILYSPELFQVNRGYRQT